MFGLTYPDSNQVADPGVINRQSNLILKHIHFLPKTRLHDET